MTDTRASHIAELVSSLTGCEHDAAVEAVAGSYRPTISTDGALELAARSITELQADARGLRIAPYSVPDARAIAAKHRPARVSGIDRFERGRRHQTHRVLRLWGRPVQGRTAAG